MEVLRAWVEAMEEVVQEERLVETEVQGDGTQLVGLKEAYFAFRVGGLISLLNQLPSPINQFRAAASSMRYSDNLNFLSRELFVFQFLYSLLLGCNARELLSEFRNILLTYLIFSPFL